MFTSTSSDRWFKGGIFFVLITAIFLYWMLQPVSAAPGTIEGTVTDEGASPIEGADVTVENAVTGAFVGFDTTNSSGIYAISVPGPGTYRVFVEVSGFAKEYYNDQVASFDFGDDVVVGDGATVTGIDFVMSPGGSVSGNVTDLASPLENIPIDAVFDLGGGVTYGMGACTDASGNYTIDGLPLDAEFSIQAAYFDNRCGGSDDYVLEFYDDTVYDDRMLFTLTDASPGVSDTLIDINFELEVGGTVSGTVTDEATGSPIPNMSIDFTSANFGLRVCTDASGNYSISGILFNDPFWLNTQGVQNDCGGPTNYVMEFTGDTYDYNQRQLLTVSAASPTINYDFALEQGGIVSGRVTDASSGAPLVDMNTSIGFNGFSFGECTDSNGDYAIVAPFNVPFYVDAASGYNFCGGVQNYVREFFNETPLWDDKTIFTLTPGSPNRNNINFTLDAGVVVSGTVFEPDGTTPVSVDGYVDITADDAPIGFGNGIGQPSPGMYHIAVLPGMYRINANAQGYARQYYNNAGAFFDDADVLNVTGNTVVDFVLQPGGSISGRITDTATGQPIANMGVDIAEGYFGVCTDSNGNYTIDHLPRNRSYQVRAGWYNFCEEPQEYVEEWWNNKPALDSANDVSITNANPHRTGINMALVRGGVISGMVTEETTGDPIEGAAVLLLGVGSMVGQGELTDENGQYLIGGIPPGVDYQVVSFKDNYDFQWYDGVDLRETATILRVEAGSRFDNVNFELGPGGTISGQVVDADTGDPVENVEVNVVGVTDYDTRCTDADGRFSFQNAPFGVEFIFSAGGNNQQCEGEPDDYLIEFWEEAETFDAATAVVLSDSLPDFDGVVFTLEKIVESTVPTNLRASGFSRVPLKLSYSWTHFAMQPAQATALGLDPLAANVPGEWYRVVVRKDDTTYIDKWYLARRICENVTCLVTPDIELYEEGTYTWFVEAWSEEGGIVSSANATFEVTLNPPAVPANIEVTTENGATVISWDDDPNASWFFITIYDGDGNVIFEGWYSKEENIVCDGTRCRFVIPADPENGALFNGSYWVDIQAWGPGGFNEGGADTRSDAVNFTLDIAASAAPGIPTNIGDDWAITNTKSGSPTFRWTPAENATWHLLWIGRLDPLPPLTRYAYWVPVSEMNCPEGLTGRCTYTPDNMFLTAEDYEYQAWLLPWGPGDGSNPFGELGKWTEFVTFDVIVDPPGIATPMTPTGMTDTTTPIFQWDHVPDVTWYNVWVGSFDDTSEPPIYETFHFDWHRAREIGCLGEGICTIDPEDLFLPQNEYIWFILTYNPAGLGEWSDSGGFTVDKP